MPTVFTKNRDRLLNQDVARQFLARVVDRAAAWMSDEHFTVDDTLIEAWASHKSFQPKDGPPDGDGRNFHGQTGTNDTHASKTDPDARLYRKSFQSEARLAYLGHVLMENRHGLIVDGMATTADGHAERDAALLGLRPDLERLLKLPPSRARLLCPLRRDELCACSLRPTSLPELNRTVPPPSRPSQSSPQGGGSLQGHPRP